MAEEKIEYPPLETTNFQNILQLWAHNARMYSSKVLYTWVNAKGNDDYSITYQEFWNMTGSISYHIRKQWGINAGERVILCYPFGLEFITTFVGCLRAGVIAVPVYPPNPSNITKGLKKLQLLVNDCQARLAMTTRSFRWFQRFSSIRYDWPKELNWESTDGCSGESFDEPDIRDDNLAFLQYTSGSTGDPKGVMIAMKNILCNILLCKSYLKLYDPLLHTPEMRMVSWLPPYHDMGLMCLMLPLSCGGSAWVMSPLDFLTNPPAWILTISRVKGNISMAPNFAYQLAYRKWKPSLIKKIKFDLSCWSCAVCGAEPIRKVTVNQFLDFFGQYGFKPSSFGGSYGMAENVVLVCSQPGPPIYSKKVPSAISCGVLSLSELYNVHMLMVDPDTCLPVPDGTPGEIWYSDSSKAMGYWNNPDKTKHDFQGKIADPTHPWAHEEFLRSGDLAFIEEGRLYFSTRLKDMIIIRGRNFYPNDIEFEIEQCSKVIRPGCVAAFSVSAEDTEHCIVVAEVREKEIEKNFNWDQLVSEIRSNLDPSIPLHTIVFIVEKTIYKTTSGKIQRNKTKLGFQNNELKMLHRHDYTVVDATEQKSECKIKELDKSFASLSLKQIRPISKPESKEEEENEKEEKEFQLIIDDSRPLLDIITEMVASMLGVDTIEPDANLFELGMNSLTAAFLLGQIREATGAEIAVSYLFTQPTIQSVIDSIESVRTIPISCLDIELFHRSNHKLVKEEKDIHLATEVIIATSGQQRLWYLNEMNPSMYNLCNCYRVRGDLDYRRLEISMQRVIERHPSLRTTFIQKDGKVYQLIHGLKHVTSLFKLEINDISEIKNEDPQNQCNKLMSEFFNRPFNINTMEPSLMIRLSIYIINKKDIRMALCWHHIATDGWSSMILVNEMSSFYSDPDTILPELQIDLGDYALWEKEYLNSSHFQKHLQYWKTKLYDNYEPLNLPIDFSRPSVVTHRGKTIQSEIPLELFSNFSMMCNHNNVTLTMALLACYQLMLLRYSRQNSVFVGIPTAGRVHPLIEKVIGFFVNTLTIQAEQPESEHTFVQFLHNIRANVLGALDHQLVPFEYVVKEVVLRAEQNRLPLVQTMFVFQQSTSDGAMLRPSLEEEEGKSRVSLGNVDLEKYEFITQQNSSKFELSCEIYSEPNKNPILEIEFNVDLFQTSTIERMMSHLTNLLRIGSERFLAPLIELHMLTSKEEKEIILQGTSHMKPYNGPYTLKEIFESQCAKTPNNIAVEYLDQKVNYQQLDIFSNRLANAMVKETVEVGDLVMLVTERSELMCIAMVSILKCGAAYIPISLQYPDERIRYIVEDTWPTLILCSKQGRDRLVEMDLEMDYLIIEDVIYDEQRNSQSLPTSFDGDTMAYIIFTSGSTGNPKGVILSNRPVTYLLDAMKFTLNLQNGPPRFLQVIEYFFDPHVAQFWLPMSCGGALICCNQSDILNDFPLLVNKNNVNHFLSTPGQLSTVPPNSLPSQCTIYSGGETMSAFLATHWAPAPRRLFNVYGPTEACVLATLLLCKPKMKSFSSIGTPLTSASFYIIDQNHHLLPIGAIGEGCLGGPQLAIGYNNRDDITKKVFIPNPFSSEKGSRIYKTGDLCRWLPNGEIDFLGRIDFQVKIRGFRIELGEIENVLNLTMGVKSNIVIVREDRPGQKKLVAFVEPQMDTVLDEITLSEHCSNYLPAYMVPSFIVILPKMPLTLTGKIDRKSLMVMPLPKNVELGGKRIHPKTDIEMQLAGIWNEVLQIGKSPEQINICSDFFEEGGNSQLAAQFVSQVRIKCKAVISIMDLMKERSILGISKKISRMAPLLDVVNRNLSRKFASFSNSMAAKTAKNKNKTKFLPLPQVPGLGQSFANSKKIIESNQLNLSINQSAKKPINVELGVVKESESKMSIPDTKDKVNDTIIDFGSIEEEFEHPTPMGSWYVPIAQFLWIVLIFGLIACSVIVGFYVSYITNEAINIKGWAEMFIIFSLIPLSLVTTALTLLFMILISKWIIIGRYQPGLYPIYSGYFLRWWIVEKLSWISTWCTSYLTGSPLLNIWYRLMGANIGSNVIIDTCELYEFDFISIGDNTIVQKGAKLRGSVFEDGLLRLDRIIIGKNCTVSQRSVICCSDVPQMPDNTLLPPLRSLPNPNTKLEKNNLEIESHGFFFTFFQIIALIFLSIMTALCQFPLIVMIYQVDDVTWSFTWLFAKEWTYILFLIPFFFVGGTIIYFFLVFLFKRLVVCKFTLGNDIPHSSFNSFTYWFLEKMFEHPFIQYFQVVLMYCPLLSIAYNLLGMNAPLGALLEPLETIEHDAVTIHPYSSTGGDVSLNISQTTSSGINRQPIVIGEGCFIGSHAHLDGGVTLQNNVLLSSLSYAPQGTNFHSNSVWIGVPAQHMFNLKADTQIPKPPACLFSFLAILQLIVAFGVIPFIMGFSMTIVGLIYKLVVIATNWYYGLIIIAFIGPFCFFLILAIIGIVLKWLFIWRLTEGTYSLASFTFFRFWFCTFLVNLPILLIFLMGHTPFLTWYYRLCGASIGDNVCMGACLEPAMDLLKIGDGAVLGDFYRLDCHSFDYGVMTLKSTIVGDCSSVGHFAVLQSGVTVENGVDIAPLSLIMKSEVLPSLTRWIGSPAEVFTDYL